MSTVRRAWLQRIYLAQVYVHARKVCSMCGTYLDVSDFDGFGAQPCEECRVETRRASGLWHYGKPRGAVWGFPVTSR